MKARNNTTNNHRLLFEKYNCEIITQTKDFLIAIPYDWKCAVFFNSFKCGGEEAHWWIGDRETTECWDYHLKAGDIFALVFFPQKHPLFGKKIICQYDMEYDDFVFWKQNDEPFSIPRDPGFLDLLYNLKKNNSLPWKILPEIWYLFLFFEREKKKQLFFDFDIFSGICIKDNIVKKITAIFLLWLIRKKTEQEPKNLLHEIGSKNNG